MFSFELLQKYLFSKRASSLVRTIARVCVIGIGVGIFSFIVVLTVMNGFDEAIKRRFLAVDPHIVVKGESASRIAKMPEVVRMDEYEKQDVILRTSDELFSGAVAKGLDSESLKKLFTDMENSKKRKKGDPKNFVLPQIVDDLKENEVIVGVDLAKSLGVLEGDEIVVIPPETLLMPAGELPVVEKVKIRATFSAEIADIDSQLFFYKRGQSLKSFQKNLSRETGVEIRIQNPSRYQEVVDRLKLQGFNAQSWADRNSTLFFSLKLEKFTMGTFLGLSAVITAFSIVNILTLLISQKRRDIGILMAMGFSPKTCQKVFTRVGLILAGLGLGSGIILGLIVSFLMDKYPLEVLPDIYYDSTIPAKIDWPFVGLTIILAIVVAFVTAWLPTRRLIRLTPTEALRKS